MLWWPRRGSASEAHSLDTYVVNIRHELGDVIQVVNLPWRAFVSRLVVSENDRVAGFQHMIEMFHSFTDSKKLSYILNAVQVKLSSCNYRTHSEAIVSS